MFETRVSEVIDTFLGSFEDHPKLLAVSHALKAVRTSMPDVALGDQDLRTAIVERAMAAGFGIEFDEKA